MKRSIKQFLWGVGSILVLLAVIVFFLFIKMKSEIKNMIAVETQEVAPGIYAIKDSFVNMFLVKDSDNYIAIDAGNDVETISAELKKLNIKPDKIKAIFLTHCDGDHTAALTLFKNAKVYYSRQEVQMIDGTTPKILFMHNSLSRKECTLLDDQQTSTVGIIQIKGISTPGHTPGSMSYIINDKYLFVGDAFGLKGGKITKPNRFFTKDMKAGIESFQKINKLPKVEYIFTAHTGYSSDYKNAVNTTLKK